MKRIWFEVRLGDTSGSFHTLKEAREDLKDAMTGYERKHPEMTVENKAYWRRASAEMVIVQISQTEKIIK